MAKRDNQSMLKKIINILRYLIAIGFNPQIMADVRQNRIRNKSQNEYK